MPIHLRRTRRNLFIFLLMIAPACLLAQETTIPAANPDAPGERLVLRDESIDQVLALLERLTGRSIIRPQALPTPTFTFTSQRPMTRDEMILAIQSMLSINGVGVSPMGDMFLRVVPLAQIRQQSPEFLSEPASNLPASGRVVSRLLELDFLRIPEIQAQLNLMLSQQGGSIIPFEKSNSFLVTDTISNIQAMEALLTQVDVPSLPKTETRFFTIRYGRAGEIVSQVQAFATGPGGLELGAGTVLTADERTNQVIVVADRRQMAFFEGFIEKLDIQAELMTKNEVLYLKHAMAVDVASLLTQLVTGSRSGMSSGGAGGSSRTNTRTPSRSGGRSNRSQIGQGSQRSSTGSGNQRQQNTNRNTPRMPVIPGANVRTQGADVGAMGADVGAMQAATEAVQDTLGEAGETDFSETLSIIPDERSNAIIISGTRQDIAMVTELIEKIDIVLAQVRIEVFIAEVTLSEDAASGIDAFNIKYKEGGGLSFGGSGPGWTLSRSAALEWEAMLGRAAGNSNVKVLSTPTIVTTHNREATILVGERRPIITGTSEGNYSGGTIRSQVTYEDIGIELMVLPLIGNDGTIQLEIDQKVDNIVGTVTIDNNEQPIIGTRQATSFVTVADRETIILGGLQSSEKSKTKNRLGIVGQIPVIGGIFGSKKEEEIRRELLVFIRPTVLMSTTDAYKDAQEALRRNVLYEELEDRMNPPPPPEPPLPPSFSPDAEALREAREAQQVEKQEQEGIIGENLNSTDSPPGFSPAARELRERNEEKRQEAEALEEEDSTTTAETT